MKERINLLKDVSFDYSTVYCRTKQRSKFQFIHSENKQEEKFTATGITNLTIEEPTAQAKILATDTCCTSQALNFHWNDLPNLHLPTIS
jgi:hypothetical protein